VNRSPPQRTDEFDRILALPRRPAEYPDDEAKALVSAMTLMLRTHVGTMTLRPIQAIALFEIGQCMGGFLPIRVSGGKTIVSLLSPTILGARRPLLLVPAALVEATRRRWRELAYHWQIYPMIEIRSYQWLSRVAAADFLESMQPDAIVLDECHKAKDLGRSVARRLRRYLESSKDRVSVVAMTGTVTKRSVRDYAHIVGWSLGAAASPLPNGWNELDSWSYALDPPSRAEIERGEDERPVGALCDLPGDGARDGYRRRLTETFGVVSTKETAIDIPILIDRFRPPVPHAIRLAVEQMRETWATPDDMVFTDAPALWRHCRELALGFYYRWRDPPPKPWLDARRAWSSAAREIHTHGKRGLDTILQISNAIDAGLYPEASEPLRAWRAIEGVYKPVTVPVWVDDYVIDALASDALSGPPTWYWTEHTAFAIRLAERTGLPYYGPGASTQEGRSILDHPRGSSGILSYHSCREGLDLQYVARNFFTFTPADGPDRFEQALGRTHRDGQEADEVIVRIVSTCQEHEKALDTLIRDAQYIQQTTGQQQKVLIADWTDE